MKSSKKIFASLSVLAIFFICQLSLAAESSVAGENNAAQPSAENTWLSQLAEPIRLKGDEVTLKLGVSPAIVSNIR